MKIGAHDRRIPKAALEDSRSFGSVDERVSLRTRVAHIAGLPRKIL
jgi:hypothetical protein